VITRSVEDLDNEINSLLADGYRLDMIMPADEPRLAALSRDGQVIRLEVDRSGRGSTSKSKGRAGMEYRDLIPDRLGGRLIASHIRLTSGGEVPDYVHYHKLSFQMIYCKAGWVRVVYEDQGQPFVLTAGDCVLQPPEIRHRVLESSAGAEVIEISSPAEHETWVDHDLKLPTEQTCIEREFGGQTFVRHVAAEADWVTTGTSTSRDTGIGAATKGLAGAHVTRFNKTAEMGIRAEATTFVYVLAGELSIKGAKMRAEESSVFLPSENVDRDLVAFAGSELLCVSFSSKWDHLFFATSVPTDVEP
jgi:quercetin dioxygenase-like cupin family protein